MNLLALVESPDHVCCRYRIRAFAPALEQAGWSLTCEGLERGVVPRVVQLRRAARFDAVILQRKLLPAWQLRILRRAARRLVFDFDDAVLFRDSYDPRGPRRPPPSPPVRRDDRASADTVVAGNDFLADCALRAGARVERRPRDPDLRRPAALPGRAARVRRRAASTWSGSARRARSGAWSSPARSGSAWRRPCPGSGSG